MPKYAAQTEVSSDRSKTEIERTLARYGADQFMYGWSKNAAVVGFRMHERMIRFHLPMPDRTSDEFRYTPSRGYLRDERAQEAAYEQAVRQRWRALALVVKAKLEAVDAGITTFEEEFLAHIMLPDGETVGDWIRPQIEEAYRLGTMPSLLPMLPTGRR